MPTVLPSKLREEATSDAPSARGSAPIGSKLLSSDSANKSPPGGGMGGSPEVEIVHGEPLTDRKSTFQAHVAEVHSVTDVRW